MLKCNFISYILQSFILNYFIIVKKRENKWLKNVNFFIKKYFVLLIEKNNKKIKEYKYIFYQFKIIRFNLIF